MNRRRLRQHVFDGDDCALRATVRLSSWTCGGDTYWWQASNMRLFHDAPAPHGLDPSPEARALRALTGCTCDVSCAEARHSAISELRSHTRASAQQAHGRGSRNPARRVQHALPDDFFETHARERLTRRLLDAVEPRLKRMLPDNPGQIAAFVNTEAYPLAEQGAEIRLHLLFPHPNRCDHVGGEQCLRLRLHWLVAVLGSGLHDELPAMLVLDAVIRPPLARCLALRFHDRRFHHNGLIIPDRELVAEASALDCLRVDGVWTVREEHPVWAMDLFGTYRNGLP